LGDDSSAPAKANVRAGLAVLNELLVVSVGKLARSLACIQSE